MDRSSSCDALLILSWEYSAAAASVSTDGWLGSLLVGGGEVSWGVGGVGVRMLARVFGICEDGGGVMEDVARGAGDVKPAFAMSTCAADSERDAERPLGVSGAATSVVGMSESCDGWCRGVWWSILPDARTVQAMRNKLGVRGEISVFRSQCTRNARATRGVERVMRSE
jgi:hypothetical protein